jgi:hypothetical protein
MAKKFAEGTNVSVSRSREEIEKNLNRHGATGFLYGDQGNRAAIAFELEGRRYRMELLYPAPEAFAIGKRNQYSEYQRSPAQMRAAQEQEKQRLWRGLALLVKAKLEAVASGISTIEEELLSYTVMPNNQTVGEWLEPQLDEVYRSGKMPPLIPGLAVGPKQIGGKSNIVEGESHAV